MQCKKCGGDTKYVEGITKSGINAGKKWQAYFCQDKNCKEPNFVKTFTPEPQIQKQTPINEPEILKLLLDILRKLDELKALMEIKNQIFKGSKLESVKPEQEPF